MSDFQDALQSLCAQADDLCKAALALRQKADALRMYATARPKPRAVWVMAKNVEVGWQLKVSGLRAPVTISSAGQSGNGNVTISYDGYKGFVTFPCDKKVMVWKTR